MEGNLKRARVGIFITVCREKAIKYVKKESISIETLREERQKNEVKLNRMEGDIKREGEGEKFCQCTVGRLVNK